MGNWLTSQHCSAIIDLIDRATRKTGLFAAWLILVMALGETAVVILRYGLDKGSIALQETILYLHASAFLLGAAYTLLEDEHVRVDIFYRSASARYRHWVNLAGTVLLLLPVTGFIFWSSLPYVTQSWQIREASADAGGLAGVYLLKTLIPIFALLLAFQGISQALKSLRAITAR